VPTATRRNRGAIRRDPHYDPADEARRVRAREAAAAFRLEGFGLMVTDGPHEGTHWALSRARNEAGRQR